MFRYSRPAANVVLFEMSGPQSVADGAAYIRALHDLSASETTSSVPVLPVVLIMTVDGQADQDHETRKQAAAWFKQNRGRLSQFLCGAIRVEPDAHDGHAAHVENSNFAKMLPFALKHADSLEEAFVMAENWPVSPAPKGAF
ncbi:hypothetical protein [Thalassospira alkalitolerans]|uniref:hypothetical protein n=1 Tax=Thalassospira alkalitolerans TaxID=1293890 RepID=UPI003AA9D0E5